MLHPIFDVILSQVRPPPGPVGMKETPHDKWCPFCEGEGTLLYDENTVVVCKNCNGTGVWR